MKNPWQQMPLAVYEAHMGFDGIEQLQALNRIMKSQWTAYAGAVSAAVLGVAGGNGLEYCGTNLEIIYGIDVNAEYLQECGRRFFPSLGSRLQLIEADIGKLGTRLPEVDLLIADLVIEYMGTEIFCAKAAESLAKYISCVIQAVAKNDFVSESPYQSEFEEIGLFHHDINEITLTANFQKYGYQQVVREVIDLPNGKQFVRLDYCWSKGETMSETIIQNEYFV